MDSPFKDGEDHNQQREEAMLKNVSYAEAFPKPVRSQRPILSVGPQKQEYRQAQKQQWPVSRPPCLARSTCQREQAGQENDHACPVMIVFRPCNISRRARLQCRSARNIGGWNAKRFRLLLEHLFVCFAKLAQCWCAKTGKAWTETLCQIVCGNSPRRQIHCRGLRPERGSRQNDSEANADFSLHQASQPADARLRTPRQITHQREV